MIFKSKSSFCICLYAFFQTMNCKSYLTGYKHTLIRYLHIVIGFTFIVSRFRYSPVMLYHPVAEHLPQDIAAELRQRGVDEQVLLVQCFCQRAARTRVFFLYPRVPHETGDYLQRTDRFIQFGCRLFYFFFGTVPITTCPVVCVLPKSIQYKGVS